MKQYLDLVRILRDKLVASGATPNRTDVPAAKIFGYQMRFDLSNGQLPAVTTKKLHLKSSIEEQLWINRGSTDNTELNAVGVSIWNEWAIPEDEGREHLMSLGGRLRKYAEQQGETEAWAHDTVQRTAHEQNQKSGPNPMPLVGLKLGEKMHEVLDQLNIPRAWMSIRHAKGTLGPIYGKQLRTFPAGRFFYNLTLGELSQYIGMMAPDQLAVLKKDAASPNGRGIDLSTARTVLTEDIGIDQLAQAIHLLKTKPLSRRNIICLWNPQVVPTDEVEVEGETLRGAAAAIENVRRGRAALASCHTLFQFNTEPLSFKERETWLREAWISYIPSNAHLAITPENIDGFYVNGKSAPKFRLSGQLYQRSADVFLGVPFNVVNYSLLIHMAAHVTNMLPGEFVWTGGDTHLYANHLEAVNTQLEREPFPAPTVKLNPAIDNIFDFKYEDIEVVGYQSHKRIKGEVAA